MAEVEYLCSQASMCAVRSRCPHGIPHRLQRGCGLGICKRFRTDNGGGCSWAMVLCLPRKQKRESA